MISYIYSLFLKSLYKYSEAMDPNTLQSTEHKSIFRIQNSEKVSCLSLDMTEFYTLWKVVTIDK